MASLRPTLRFPLLGLLRPLRVSVACLLLGLLATLPLYAAPGAQDDERCVELLVDGDFETPGAGWRVAADSYLFSYSSEMAASGRQALLLAFPPGFDTPAVMAATQPVNLPAARLALTVAYRVRQEGPPRPTQRAALLLTDATTGETLLDVELPPTGATGWTQARHDLSAVDGLPRRVALTFALNHDGQSPPLTLLVDAVSLTACGPAEVVSPYAAAPPALPAAMASPGAPSGAPPAVAPVPTLAGLPPCDCRATRYTCADFESWAAAQACYTLCLASAGYDIHGLDPDGNGIACELALPDLTAQAALTPLQAAETPQDEASGPAVPPTAPAHPDAPPDDEHAGDAQRQPLATPAADPVAPATPGAPPALPRDSTLPLQILTVLVVFAVGVLLVGGVVAAVVYRAAR